MTTYITAESYCLPTACRQGPACRKEIVTIDIGYQETPQTSKYAMTTWAVNHVWTGTAETIMNSANLMLQGTMSLSRCIQLLAND